MKFGVTLSPQLTEAFKEIELSLAKDVLNHYCQSTVVDYLDIVPGNYDMLSFLPTSRVESVSKDQYFICEQRQKAKVGVVLNKIIFDQTDNQIREVIESYKSASPDPTAYEFKIVSGEEVIWAFDRENNYLLSDLGASCMVNNDFRKSSLDFLVVNPDKFKVAVVLKNNKIQARVLIGTAFNLIGEYKHNEINYTTELREHWQAAQIYASNIHSAKALEYYLSKLDEKIIWRSYVRNQADPPRRIEEGGNLFYKETSISKRPACEMWVKPMEGSRGQISFEVIKNMNGSSSITLINGMDKVWIY